MTNPPDPKTKTPRTDKCLSQYDDFGQYRSEPRRLELLAIESSTLELENQSLTRRLEEVTAINKKACADWADDDTAIKKLAAPFGIREDDTPGYFKNSVQVVEEMAAKLTALRTAAEGARDALKATKAAMLNHAGWNQNFDPTTHRELPMTRPADVALAESKATAALAALRAELDQADSNASNSPTASRDK